MLDVADTGVGMSADTLKRVFEPFFTTKEVGKGSGLGLSMVYGFVQQSGGHVHIASVAGSKARPCTCTFRERMRRVESASLEPDRPADLPRGSETMLVVEDNVEVRTTAVEILASLGYRVLEASNGRSGAGAIHATSGHRAGVLGRHVAGRPARHAARDRNCASVAPALKVLLTSGFSESGVHAAAACSTAQSSCCRNRIKVEDLARRVRAKLDGKEEMQRVPA